jgi:hypothetical protein
VDKRPDHSQDGLDANARFGRCCRQHSPLSTLLRMHSAFHATSNTPHMCWWIVCMRERSGDERGWSGACAAAMCARSAPLVGARSAPLGCWCVKGGAKRRRNHCSERGQQGVEAGDLRRPPPWGSAPPRGALRAPMMRDSRAASSRHSPFSPTPKCLHASANAEKSATRPPQLRTRAARRQPHFCALFRRAGADFCLLCCACAVCTLLPACC